MEIFLNCSESEQAVYLRALAEDPEIQTIARLRRVVYPGETYAGYTYEEYTALGTGRHELTIPKPTPQCNASPAANTPAAAS